MIRSKAFVAIFAALCTSAALAAVSELLTWPLHLNNLAAEVLWVVACALIGLIIVLHPRLRASEMLVIGGTVLVATAGWQVVKWPIVLLEGTSQIAGLSYQLALLLRIGVEVLILALLVFFATRPRRGTAST